MLEAALWDTACIVLKHKVYHTIPGKIVYESVSLFVTCIITEILENGF